MSPERWIQVKTILDAALAQPSINRSAFASQACGADKELFVEVESLLAFDNADENDIFEKGQLSPVAEARTNQYTNGFIGKKIDKYQIVRELGAGGMGVVFLAERTDDEFEQKVAIKFLRHFFSQNAFQLFLLERQILARLHHQYIAQLIDGGTTAEGTPYLVMEYVEGTSIIDYADEKNLNLEDRLDLFCKVCSAVSFAHRNFIVHRDLKPDNILITADGTPKLLDFGIAKLLSETEIKATVTRRQAFTPEYASPEQITGGAITTASDVYVLGIILYELLSGKRPFQAADTAAQKEIWYVVNRDEPLKPSSAANQFKIKNSKLKIQEPQNPKSKIQNPKLLKGDLDNIVLKALKREPERRYQSIEQLTEDLSRYEKGLPVKAHSDTVLYRAGKFAGRHRFGLLAICLVILSLLIGLVSTLQQSRRAERERLRAEQRAENLRAISKSVVFDIHDAIRNLPGSLPARELLLKQAVEQLRVSAQDAESNPVMQDELAQAYFNVGEMQQALGNVAEAEESHRRAVAIYQKLIEANPHEAAYLRGLARGYGFLANMAYLRGEAGKSSEIYAQAPVILEQIVAENPNDVKNLEELWSAYSDYAASLYKLGKTDEALTAAQKALTVANKLNQAENSNTDSRQMLIQTKGLIAASYGLQGDYQKAVAELGEVINEAEKLREEFPDDTRFQYNLWAYYRRLGIVHDKAGDFGAAIQNLEKSLRLIETLAKSSPKDAGYKRNTAITLLALGQAYLNHDAPKRALPVLLEARKLSETLLANDGNNGETIADLAFIYGSLGAAFERNGELDQAVSLQEKSLELFARAFAKTPENIELKREYLKTTEQAAETYTQSAKQHNPEKAKTFAEKANLLFEQSRRLQQ